MGLLSSILKIQSSPTDSSAMREFICDQLRAIEGVEYRQDAAGNIYATKRGKDSRAAPAAWTVSRYPTYVCRTDTPFEILPNGRYEVFRGYFRHSKGHVWLAAEKTENGYIPAGIGAAAKSGVYVCLQLLRRLESVKCVFFANHETEFAGAKACDLTFFKESRWVVEIGQSGGGSIVTTGLDVELAPQYFKNRFEFLGRDFNYHLAQGAPTSSAWLLANGLLKLAAISLSSGYFNPNTKKEFISEKALLNTVEFCVKLNKEITYSCEMLKVMPLPKKTVTPGIAKRKCEAPGCGVDLPDHYYTLCPKCETLIGKAKCTECPNILRYKYEVASGKCYSCEKIRDNWSARRTAIL